MSDPARWTTASQIADAVRRRWNDGTLLRGAVTGDPFAVIDLPLRGPSSADLGEHFDDARAWADAVRRASRGGRAYTIVDGHIGGRSTGITSRPERAQITSYEQAWELLGTGARADLATYRQIVATSEPRPNAVEWALAHPLRAVAMGSEWATVMAALDWLTAHRHTGLYLRQVDAPGVDTKFIDRHRSALAGMLGVPHARTSFERALGYATRPTTVRLRFDPALLGFPPGVSEAALRTTELNTLDIAPTRALIVENEISYLSVPVPAGCVAIWGRGYDAGEPASLRWLAGRPVDYWGDIDTHGFSILNRVRSHLPQTRSVLMDAPTLLTHEDRWGTESEPTRAELPHLTDDEKVVYSDLVTGRHGPDVRLEQERLDWQWVSERLWNGSAGSH